MSQSRKLSLIESLTNVAVGFGVSLASQIVIFSGYGVKLPLIDNIAITAWFTLISVARSYLLRRAFNYPWRRLAAEWKYRNDDPGVCCCGADLGEGGDICYHGGCRSAKDWAIECYANGGRISTPAPAPKTGARVLTTADLRERFDREGA